MQVGPQWVIQPLHIQVKFVTIVLELSMSPSKKPHWLGGTCLVSS